MGNTRRQFLASLGSSLLVSRVALGATSSTDPRFIFVILRGALDGLAAVPPIGDPDYARLRGDLALSAAGGALRLNDTFALHPSLSFLSRQWQARQLAVVHAVSTPYRERSHFDAQDVLETGFARAHASRSGWLNRALMGLPDAQSSSRKTAGVALGANVPLVMRGEVEVASWSPDRMPGVDDDTLQRLGDLYASDPLLSRRLADALAAKEMSSNMADGQGEGQGDGKADARGAQVTQTARATANFLAQEHGPRVAVFETTGWDTHANEGSDKGALALRLKALDTALSTLHDAMGEAWQHTTVLVATEFGRTAAINGTRGTDHGTGAAAFLLGGAVRGGQMITRWPGLTANALYEGRDLAPTTDLRSVIKSLLRDHMGVAPALIDRDVFPDSSAAPYMQGLV
ncbi:MAG: DUF1501 domain-containing protein [Pseudomonadota bacterium]